MLTKISGNPSEEISPMNILPGCILSSSENRSAAFGSLVITYFTTFRSSTGYEKLE
jgi:hypothetical protein